MAGQDAYDEAAIKRRWADLPFTRRLPEAKRELLQMILRSMRRFHARRTPQREAIAAYLDGLYLGRKGLARLAERAMRDAVAAAALTENHALRSLVKQGQISAQRSEGRGVEPTSPYTEDPVVLEALGALEVAKVQALLERLQSAVKRYGQTTNPAALAIAGDLIGHGQELQPLTTVAARQLWLRMHSLHRFFFLNDPQGALELDRERLRVLEESESYRRSNLSSWLALLHSVALRLAVLGRIDEAIPLRDTVRTYWSDDRSDLSAGLRHNALGQYLNLEIFMATRTLNVPSTPAMRAHLSDLIREHERQHLSEIGVAAWFNLALLEFAEGHFRQAIRTLNETDAYPVDLRTDTRRASIYLRILCHAELEHDSVVVSMVRRQRRDLKGAPVSPSEEVFLTCMAAYLNTTPGTHRLRLLRTTLDGLLTVSHGHEASTPVGMFAFSAWLRSKIERRPWRELALEP